MRIVVGFRVMAIVNGVLALFLAFVAGWAFRTARLEVEYAIRTYGFNVDAGARLELFAWLVAPAAFAFGVAFIGFWWGLWIRWLLQLAPRRLVRIRNRMPDVWAGL